MVEVTKEEIKRTSLRALGTALIAYGILLYSQTMVWQGVVGIILGVLLYFAKDIWEYIEE